MVGVVIWFLKSRFVGKWKKWGGIKKDRFQILQHEYYEKKNKTAYNLDMMSFLFLAFNKVSKFLFHIGRSLRKMTQFTSLSEEASRVVDPWKTRLPWIKGTIATSCLAGEKYSISRLRDTRFIKPFWPPWQTPISSSWRSGFWTPQRQLVVWIPDTYQRQLAVSIPDYRQTRRLLNAVLNSLTATRSNLGKRFQYRTATILENVSTLNPRWRNTGSKNC